MKLFLDYNNKVPQFITLVSGALIVFLLGIIDHLTGFEISFSIFYLLPIMIVAWLSKKKYAAIIALLSALTWLWADLASGHTYSHLAIPIWNLIMRFGLFLIVAFALSTIKKLLAEEQLFARTDFLTEAYNSRAFYELAKNEIDRVHRFGRPIAIAYLDIDNFKQVNDTLGHSAGDNLLRVVVRTMKQITRSIDIISRLGGDEFVILMPETDDESARMAMNKIHKNLLKTVEENKWPITFSIGVVICDTSCTVDELIKEADSLMYSVKGSGKNRIDYRIFKPSL